MFKEVDMSICIFPGTFNPIHNGHLKMADYVLKKYRFEKVIFIPAYIPPHKELATSLANHRFNMVKLATLMNPKIEVSDFEYMNENKSYTIYTIKHFIEEYKIYGKINMIIGTDAFSKLDTWYKSDEIKNLVHFIVFPRIGDNVEEIVDKYRNLGWDFEITDTEYINISSTDVRTKSLRGIDKKIKDYITKNELYKA